MVFTPRTAPPCEAVKHLPWDRKGDKEKGTDLFGCSNLGSINKSVPFCPQLFTCHDYPPDGRTPCPSCTVAQQLADNERVRPAVSEKEFVAWRMQRDATLGAPRLLKPSLLVNLRAGVVPGAQIAGVRFSFRAVR